MNQSTNAPPLDRSFAWLNLTQFFGALNDNLFKLLIIFFLIDRQGPESAGATAALAGGIFVIPFLLFSPLAGGFADRLSKSRLIVAAKALELGVMIFGVGAFLLSSPAGLYAALFLMGLQSTFFSPAKYGILPELVPREGLSRANGLLESFTYLAIILGTAFAAALPSLSGGHFETGALSCVAISLVGGMASLRIPQTAAALPAGEHRRSALCQGREVWKTLRSDGYLMLAVVGAALFMLLGAFVQLNLIPYGMEELALSQEGSGGLFLIAAVGIGAGSLCAGRLSGRNVELGVVPVGAILLLGGSLLLALLPGTPTVSLAAIFILGTGAGLFIVPIQAFIQLRSPAESRGKILAAANFLGWSGVLGAAVLTHLLSDTLSLSARQGFLSLTLLSLLLTTATLAVLPDFLLRFLALAVMRFGYRVRVSGEEAVPTEGGALLVANHVSWIDALLLLATQQRRIRFLMERGIYHTPLLRPLFRLMGAIPIAAGDGRRDLLASLRQARTALDEGSLVCIFAEGAITRNGTLQPFRPGFERIVAGSNHPVIPVHIGGVWGSVFSYARRTTIPRRPAPVLIDFGAPLPATATAAEVRQAVMELSADSFARSRRDHPSLAEGLVRSARRNWRRPALADTSGQALTYGMTLTGALALKKRLSPLLGKEHRIGVLLPPSVGGALANLALTLSGKVPVNLNYTASAENQRSALAQAGLTSVITSRLFLKRIGDLPLPEKVLYLEEILPCLGGAEKLRAWLAARLLPTPLLVKAKGRRLDPLATIIFSSGSTGEPKGVMLSQHNILANIEALRMVFPVDRNDNLCGVLPFFHSFGYTGTLWLPLLSGFSAVYHPNPLESSKVAETVKRHRSTFLLATPTFLGAYLRRATPENFATLRYVATCAEKFRTPLAPAFAEEFGLTALEGYGATELAPVAAINTPEVRRGGILQTGSRSGTVGRPLPGVAVRVVDPETETPRSPEERGLVLFKGANVMVGYLGKPEESAEVLKGGWYHSGDIGHLDAQGFLRITDRHARFSKIGGEMVPHGALEEALQQGLATEEPVVAVTAVADSKKGERLVVLFTPAAGSRETLRAILGKSPLPNLWKPAPGDYLPVPEIPVLGSGKLDLQALKGLARGAA